MQAQCEVRRKFLNLEWLEPILPDEPHFFNYLLVLFQTLHSSLISRWSMLENTFILILEH